MNFVQATAIENQDFYYQLVRPDHIWFKARVDMLEHLLKKNQVSLYGQRGLEIGCGNSMLSSQIEKKYNCTIDGIDLSQATNRMPTKGSFFQLDITRDLSTVKGDCDFIILFDIMEHIENVPEFMNACVRYLKPGGYLLVNVPAHHFLWSRYDKIAGHLRRYTRQLLHTHLTSHSVSNQSLVEVEQAYWGFFFVPLLIIRKLILSFKKNKSDKEVYMQGFAVPCALNRVLTFLWSLEMRFLGLTGIGTSILAIYRKPARVV